MISVILACRYQHPLCSCRRPAVSVHGRTVVFRPRTPVVLWWPTVNARRRRQDTTTPATDRQLSTFPGTEDDGLSTRDERLLIMAAYRGLAVRARAHVQSIMHAPRAPALRGRVWMMAGDSISLNSNTA